MILTVGELRKTLEGHKDDVQVSILATGVIDDIVSERDGYIKITGLDSDGTQLFINIEAVVEPTEDDEDVESQTERIERMEHELGRCHGGPECEYLEAGEVWTDFTDMRDRL